MKAIFGLVLTLVSMSFAHADSPAPVDVSSGRVHGFVAVNNQRSLFVDYRAAQPGQPTLVMINGLTDATTNWDAFVKALSDTGYGLVRFDMMGQGQTLLKYAPMTAVIPQQDNVDDMASILQALKITTPVHILGYSYGGGIALLYASQHPEMVASLILSAPYTEPVAQQDQWIRNQVTETRVMFPFNPASDDDLYDYYLRQLIYSSYPIAMPSLLDNPYALEGVFRLVQGCRKFHAARLEPKLASLKVYLIEGENDDLVQPSVLDTFWRDLPQSAHMSRMTIQDSDHMIFEKAPAFVASWVKDILAGDPRLGGDRVYTGSPTQHNATSTDTTIDNLGE